MVGRNPPLNENEQSSVVTNKRMWIVILVMLVLLFLGPIKIEVRFSTYFYPVVSLSDFTIWAWTWVYSIAGYGTTGFISPPFSQIFQHAAIDTIFQAIFLGALVGHQLGLTLMKSAKQIGYVSLFPGLLVLCVNLFGILVPGASNVIAPISTPLVSILGLVILRMKTRKPVSDSWLSEQNAE